MLNIIKSYWGAKPVFTYQFCPARLDDLFYRIYPYFCVSPCDDGHRILSNGFYFCDHALDSANHVGLVSFHFDHLSGAGKYKKKFFLPKVVDFLLWFTNLSVRFAIIAIQIQTGAFLLAILFIFRRRSPRWLIRFLLATQWFFLGFSTRRSNIWIDENSHKHISVASGELIDRISVYSCVNSLIEETWFELNRKNWVCCYIKIHGEQYEIESVLNSDFFALFIFVCSWFHQIRSVSLYSNRRS